MSFTRRDFVKSSAVAAAGVGNRSGSRCRIRLPGRSLTMAIDGPNLKTFLVIDIAPIKDSAF